MRIYKISIMIIVIVGILFIGTSNPAQNLYKNSASIIGALNDKDEAKDKKEKILICIDPGHQEKGDGNGEPIGPGSPYEKARVSSGTVGISTKKPEYVLNLEASLALKHILMSKGFDIIMTRETHNINMSNMERAEFANNKSAKMVVRIHGDGSNDSSINGASILVPAKEGKYTSPIYIESNKCAELIKNNMDSKGFKVNGIFQRDDLTGFNWSKVPVVLVEMGFMSNYNEDEMMSNPEYQKKMMQCIADGVEEYFKTN